MKQTNNNIAGINVPSPADTFQRIKRKIKKSDIVAFLFSVIIGVVAYFPLLTSWITNPDTVWHSIIYKDNFEWEKQLGRFGLPIFAKLKGYVVAPEFSVFLGILFLAASVVLIIKIFDMSQVLVCSLLSILIMISPTVISTDRKSVV